MKRILGVIYFFSLFMTSATCFALKEYYSISKSVRALGMGGVFYGLSDDEYALFYNPAGFANYRGRGEIMLGIGADSAFNTISALKRFSSTNTSNVNSIVSALEDFAGKPVYLGVNVLPFYHRKYFGVGLLVGDAKAQVGILGNNADSVLDLTFISDSGLILGFAREFMNERLKIGANFKGLYRAGAYKNYSIIELANEPSFNVNEWGGAGIGFDADLGVIYSLETVPWGIENQISLSLNNLFATNFSVSRRAGAPPALVRMLSLGYHTVFGGAGWFDHFRLMMDLAEFGLGGETDPNRGARSGDFWKHINLGMEAPLRGWFILRTGLHQGNFTFGIGLHSSAVKLDLATYAEEITLGVGKLSNRRVALRLAIGFGSPPPAPVQKSEPSSFELKSPSEPSALPSGLNKKFIQDDLENLDKQNLQDSQKNDLKSEEPVTEPSNP